jgi:hypothetical protein
VENVVTSKLGPIPPYEALNMTAQRNSVPGNANDLPLRLARPISTRGANHSEMISAAVIERTANPYLEIQDGLDNRRRLDPDIFSSDARRLPLQIANQIVIIPGLPRRGSLSNHKLNDRVVE